MIQELEECRSRIKGNDLREFEMLAKRDRDDEDLDAIGARKLEELHSKYVVRKKKIDAEELWKKLTGG
ncbi:MAG: hypothetical protein ACRDGA_01350 [Bacteroidota bacterium]